MSLTAVLVTGCGDNSLGERAQTGECPLGELCSPITPEGLHFRGAALGDQGGLVIHRTVLLPTAVGGTQTLTVVDNETRLLFDFPFTAVLTDDSLIVQLTYSASVVLYGDHEGAALLRLTDFTNRLFDRISVTARDISRFVVAPANEEIGILYDPWALYPGPTARVVGKLYAGSDQRLVDETMQLYPVDASTILSSSQDQWDCLSFETTPDATTVQVASRAGDGVERFDTVTFQDWADTVGFLIGTFTPSETMPARHTDIFPRCFEALGGDVRVLGAPWQFSVTGDATVLRESIPDSQLPIPPNCVALQTGLPGEITLTVEVPGVSRDFPMTVTSSSARRR